ncbi:MAG: hypothetical protein DSZ07_07765, partial [Sulfurovum sp.]
MLKKLILITTLLSSGLLAQTINYDFQEDNLTQWNTFGEWKISKEHILSMVERSKGSFNLCYTKSVAFLDGNVTVKFKANAGRIDQGGGIMWRVQDNDNYYVARFNPLEDNFRFYLVHDGIRSELSSADVKLTKGWHSMSIEQKGASFKGYLDGKLYLEYQEKRLNKT